MCYCLTTTLRYMLLHANCLIHFRLLWLTKVPLKNEVECYHTKAYVHHVVNTELTKYEESVRIVIIHIIKQVGISQPCAGNVKTSASWESLQIDKYFWCLETHDLRLSHHCFENNRSTACWHTQTDDCCSTLKPKIADKTPEKENSMKSNNHRDEKLFTPDSVRYSSPIAPAHFIAHDVISKYKC